MPLAVFNFYAAGIEAPDPAGEEENVVLVQSLQILYRVRVY